ncbi:MAG: hypothetical protein JXQ23_12875 [Clostridia bacterium]|nr:hypothetical protein [Clostridia bacterium]
MKKTRHCFLLFIIFLLLFSGCQKKTEERPELKLNEPLVISEKSCISYNFIYPDRRQERWTSSDIKNWNEYVKKEFKMDINLAFSSLTNYEEKIKESGFNGLIYVNNIELLKSLINKNMIIPLNEILEKVQETNVLKPIAVEALSDRDGVLWGLPAGNTFIINARSYNQDWLDKLGMKVPTTTEEFYECAKRVSKEDPDGNGINDSYIAQYANETLLDDFYDIFLAYGCYPDSKTLVEIGFNPTLNKYEDIVLNENFRAALLFIKNLKDSHLIIERKAKLSSITYKEEVGKDLLSYYDSPYLMPFDNTSVGFFLSGVNDKNLINVRAYNEYFAVLKYTENSEEIIRRFMSSSVNTDYFSLALHYGVPGELYHEVDDAYVIDTSNEKAPLGIYIYYKLLSKPAVSDINYEKKYLEGFAETVEINSQIDELLENNSNTYILPQVMILKFLSIFLAALLKNCFLLIY